MMLSDATFYLPWPDRKLSPNGRFHWSVVAKAKKKAKQDAYYLTLEAGISKIAADALSVHYTFYPPSRRAFDLDNSLSSCKAYSDGIAQAVGIDDSLWTITIKKAGVIEKHGMVKVVIEWETKGQDDGK